MGLAAFGMLALFLFVSACTTLPSLGEKQERPPEPAQDSETAVEPDWSVSLMPNDYGFTIENEYFDIQGAWYWYDSNINGAAVEQVYVYQDEEEEAKDEKLFWYGDESSLDEHVSKRRPIEDDEHVSKICIAGGTKRFLALGFEVCSTRDYDAPLEFPFPFGNCRIKDELKEGVKHFRGIEFVLESGAIRRIDVQFKEWGGSDDYLPFCTYDPAADDYEIACEWEALEKVDGRKRWHIKADARDAARYNDTGTDTESQWIRLNLSMLQAIHIQVYPATWVENFFFCISELSAFGDETPNDVEDMDSYDVEACPEPNEVAESLPSGIDWVPIESEGFEILRTEVTVAQFLECPTGVCHSDDINEWETCNTYYSENVSNKAKEQRALDRAANCVTWCQARQFCRWIGGDLPDEDQWEAAARAGRTAEEGDYPAGITPSCDFVVMNDPELGIGCGVDENLGEVCTRFNRMTAPKDTERRLCDMAGNLWEWVMDDALEDLEDIDPNDEWKAPYKKLKGGSFNSTEDSSAFEVTTSTLEHPSVPHSPTRIGFRCVRLPDASE